MNKISKSPEFSQNLATKVMLLFIILVIILKTYLTVYKFPASKKDKA